MNWMDSYEISHFQSRSECYISLHLFPTKICQNWTVACDISSSGPQCTIVYLRTEDRRGLSPLLLRRMNRVIPGSQKQAGSIHHAPAPPPTAAPTATRLRTPPPPVSRRRRLAAPMAGPARLARGAAQRPPHVGAQRPLRLRRRRGGRGPARS